MTGEELVQYFQTYCDHLPDCDKHPKRALLVYINNKASPECTCGLDNLLEDLGVPSTDNPFAGEVVLGHTENTELDIFVDMPPGLRKFDRCPRCRRENPIEMFEQIEEGIVARFQCICGNSHGIVHSGRMIRTYEKWVEMKEKKDKDGQKGTKEDIPLPEN